MPVIPSPSQPISMTISAAVRYSGLGKTSLYRLIGEGKLEAVKVMGRRLVLRASLDALIAPGAANMEDAA
ncbi:MAG: helix-turn-helix domain-containing protein [Hyphomicrobium sp.]